MTLSFSSQLSVTLYMFNFFNFGQHKKAKALEKQREMIRVALNTVLRRRKISPRHIGCEVIPMTRAGAANVVLVQLTLLSWVDGVVHDASDLENELFEVICLFTRNARKADFLFLWKFAVGRSSGSNSTDTSEKPLDGTSNLALAGKLVSVPKSEPAIKFDLPRTALDEDTPQRDSRFPPTVIDNR